MTTKKRYRLLTGACLATFILITATEVTDRWAEVYAAYQDMLNQESALQSPEELAARKLDLLERKQILVAAATGGQRSFEQNQTGVVEYLHHCATASGTTYLSLSPRTSDSKGELRDVSFSIKLRDDFHTLGQWLHTIETGSFPCEVTKVELQLGSVRHPLLDAVVFGRAFIFARAGS